MKSYALLLALLSSCCTTMAAQSLSFLGHADSTTAWVVDSNFDPTPFIGALDPPYDVGLNQLSRINLVTQQIDAAIDLGSDGAILSFELSPDGDHALVTRINQHALLWVSGLTEPATASVAEIPLQVQPLSIAFSSDGRRAAVGYQTNNLAKIALIDGLGQGVPNVHPPIALEVEGSVLAAVEAIAFSRDGERLITQTGLHDAAPPDPQFFTPRVAIQSSIVDGSQVSLGSPHYVDRESALPPTPPFEQLATGIALGDFAIACDGDRLIVPISGAADLGQPDARILILSGVRSSALAVDTVLSLAEGVDIAPFQIAASADCDRAIVTNAFGGTITEVSSIVNGPFKLSNRPLAMPFPSEPAITPDLKTLVVQHSRPPIDGVPPTSVTLYDFHNGQPLGEPIFGPVRSWIQVKDRTLATWPTGLADRVTTFGWPRWAEGLMLRQLKRLASGRGSDRWALRRLAFVSFLSHWLKYVGIANQLHNDVVQDHVDLATLAVLEKSTDASLASFKDSRPVTESAVVPNALIEELFSAMGTDSP